MRRFLSFAPLIVLASSTLLACGPERFPERAIFVAGSGSGAVSVLDPEDGKVVGEVPVDDGFHPHHLAVSADGRQIAIAAPGAPLRGYDPDAAAGTSKIYVIDASNGGETASLDVGATVHNAAFLADFSTIVLAQRERGVVSGHAVDGLAELWTAKVGADPLGITTVGTERLVVANAGDGTCSILDPATQAVIDTAEVGEAPIAAWETPLGVFVSLHGEGGVALLSPGNLGEVLGEYDFDGRPGQIAASKERDEIWIAVEDRGVVEVRTGSTGEIAHTIEVGGEPHGLLIDEVAGLVYVTDQSASRVVRVDAASHEVKDEIEVGAAPVGIVQTSL